MPLMASHDPAAGDEADLNRSEDDGTVVSADVYLIPLPNQRSYLPIQKVEAESDGSFRFGTTPPGGYALFAIAADSSLQVLDPALQGGFWRRANFV